MRASEKTPLMVGSMGSSASTSPRGLETIAENSNSTSSACDRVINEDEEEAGNVVPEEEMETSHKPRTIFRIFFIAIPVIISLIYASAVLFPPQYRAKAPILLWTDGALIRNDGILTLCPRATICSEGILQIILIAISRLTAFACYVLMGLTYSSKMHSLSHALSISYLGTMIPFALLHEVHKNAGKIYAILAFFHAIAHLIRWYLRSDMYLLHTSVGISGFLAISAMTLVVASMTRIMKRIPSISFEFRFFTHNLFHFLLTAALCFHTPRCRFITLVFTGVWFLDYLYGTIFKTYRVDLVEFTPLPDGSGTQMLWRNPKGFNANSGEYVKVQLPWMGRGGNEWHPFSLYLREATEEGLDEVLRQKYEVQKTRVHVGGYGGRVVEAETTAVLMMEIQNEFVDEEGKLHDRMKEVMEKTQMLEKTEKLADLARSMGAHIFHIPLVWGQGVQGGPNKNLGVFKTLNQSTHFEKGTWNVEIPESHRPRIGDIVINGKTGLDSFVGTDLQEQLEKRGIETVILAGFATNCGIESTMRSAYEKGYNVITLIDGTACTSIEEQETSVKYTFQMFSTPITCAEAENILRGELPRRLSNQLSRKFTLEELQGDSFRPSMNRTHEDLVEFINNRMRSGYTKDKGLIMEEARQNLRSQYDTSQIFIAPAGNWSKRVYKDVTAERQLRSCWVSGPYISPYSIASNFSHLLLVATGIGITPTLGVMGQYKGHSRLKVVIWSTRCPHMLKFFGPLLADDAKMAIIYYTGKETLSKAEVGRINHKGNIYIQQSRPKSLLDTASAIIVNTTASLGCLQCTPNSVSLLSKRQRKHWCIFYCGGVKRISDDFRRYSEENQINFESEAFDW